MFSREHRFDRETFSVAQSRGHTFRGEYFTLRVAKTDERQRFAVVVSRKVAKSAVRRHQIRRRTYAALAQIAEELDRGVHVVVFASPHVATLSYNELVEELRSQLVRAGALPSR
jgi:ribonuclease P protein component